MEGKAGDSLNVKVSKSGQVTLEWDKNDPKWMFLNKLNNDQIQQFIKAAFNDQHLSLIHI